MAMQTILAHQLACNPFFLFDRQWMLLTAGDFKAGDFNCMTVSWGSLGILWGRPFAQVVVRPTRYTHEFMQKYDTFTLCAFPLAHRDALQILGSRSGRDADKIAESGLTPIAAEMVDAPGFSQAELVFECRKMYFDDIRKQHFLDPDIDRNYPQKDYHTIYYGEIVNLRGEPKFISPVVV